MSLEASEAECAAVAVAPRVSLANIEANIAAEFFVNGTDAMSVSYPSPIPDTPVIAALHVMTLCLMVLKNGFTIVGKSACADPKNFNDALGRKLAREDCIRQIWPLMGYALCDKLARQ